MATSYMAGPYGWPLRALKLYYWVNLNENLQEGSVCVALLYQGQKFSQEALNSSTIYQKEL